MINIAESYKQDYIDMKSKYKITEDTLKTVIGFFQSDEDKEKMKEYLKEQLDMENIYQIYIWYKILDRMY